MERDAIASGPTETLSCRTYTTGVPLTALGRGVQHDRAVKSRLYIPGQHLTEQARLQTGTAVPRGGRLPRQLLQREHHLSLFDGLSDLLSSQCNG